MNDDNDETKNNDTGFDGEVLYSHSNEMTQDVIEWDESNNVDLRYVIPSPHPNEKEPTPLSSLFFGKKESLNRQQEIAQVNLDGSFQQVSGSSKRRIAGPDQEIDGILGMVQEENHQQRAANDPMDSGTLHTYTCTHRIDSVIIGFYRYFRSLSRYPNDLLDSDQAIFDLNSGNLNILLSPTHRTHMAGHLLAFENLTRILTLTG